MGVFGWPEVNGMVGERPEEEFWWWGRWWVVVGRVGLDCREEKDGGGVGCRLYGWWGNEEKKEKK
jgi:hypothetical protein